MHSFYHTHRALGRVRSGRGLCQTERIGYDAIKVREFSNDGRFPAIVGAAHFLLLQLHRQKWDAALADSARVAVPLGEPAFNLRLHVRTGGGVFFAGAGDEFFASADASLDGRKRSRAKRFGIRPVFHQPHEHFIAVEVNEAGSALPESQRREEEGTCRGEEGLARQ